MLAPSVLIKKVNVRSPAGMRLYNEPSKMSTICPFVFAVDSDRLKREGFFKEYASDLLLNLEVVEHR